MDRYRRIHRLLMIIMALSLVVTGVLTAGAPALAQAQVNLSLVPSATTIDIRGSFTVDIMVQPQGGQDVDRIDALVGFDPAVLQVTQLVKGVDNPFNDEEQNRFDNILGELRYRARQQPPPGPTTPFILATVTFSTIATSPGSAISFNPAGAITTAESNGVDVLGILTDTSVAVVDNPVNLSLVASTASVNVGGTFTVDVSVQPTGGRSVDSVSAFVDFNPAQLQVVSIAKGADNTLNTESDPGTFDNTLGRADYSASQVPPPGPTAAFTLATITFRAVAAAAPANVTFSAAALRDTGVIRGGLAMLGTATPASVTVLSNPVNLSLSSRPIVLRNQIFSVDILVQPAGSVDQVDAFINYDPTKLQVIDGDPVAAGVQITADPASPLTNVLVNTAVAPGQVDFSARLPAGPAPATSFSVASISFKAINLATAGTAISFSAVAPRQTAATEAGVPALGAVTGITVRVITAPAPTSTPVPPPAPTPVAVSGLAGAVPLQADSQGVIQTTARLATDDNELIVDVPAGTRMLDADGVALASLSAQPVAVPPAPPTGNNVVLAYNMGPDGATFDPPISITLAYNPAALGGASESGLAIAYWDGSRWITLATTVDAEANTLTAQVSHFTTFGVLAQLPPAVAITSPLNGATLQPGDVTVSVSVDNIQLVPPGDPVAGQGHLHYYLDVDIPTTPGQPAVTAPGTYKVTPDTTAVWTGLTPGVHRLGVQLVQNNHIPMVPPRTAMVTVTVAAPQPTATPVPQPTATPVLAPKLTILSPANGATLQSGDIAVSVRVDNFNLGTIAAPTSGDGHVHFYLDTEIPTTPGQLATVDPDKYKAGTGPQTEVVWDNVTPGSHTLGVQLADNNHLPVIPLVTSTITVNVVPAKLPSKVTILSPANGATLLSGDITVSVRVDNFNLGTIAAPTSGEGHVHFYLDTEIPTTPGQLATVDPDKYKAGTGPQTEVVWDNVAPGRHTLGVQLADNNHLPVIPLVTSTITVNVVPANLPPKLTILSPANGATLQSGDIAVKTLVENFNLGTIAAPTSGEGHVHFYLDTEIPTSPGQLATVDPDKYQAGTGPQTEVVWNNVAPGSHTLGVQLADNNHRPLVPLVTATVTVTVVQAPTATPQPTATAVPQPTPQPTATPVPTTEPAPATPPSETNWGLIVGIIAVVVVLLALGGLLMRRRTTG